MTSLATVLAPFVADGGTYNHISEHMAKALPKGHAFSTQRWPNDLGDGQLASGNIVCQDSRFIANERSRNHPLVLSGAVAAGHATSLPADGEKFVMGEWPTGARLRNIGYVMTIAEDGTDNTTGHFPEFADETDNWDNILDYFAVDVMAAFPPFTLWAEDPSDPTFTPFLLMPEAVSTAAKAAAVVPSIAALTWGVNRRKRPLLIVARAEGAVVANSGLFLFLEFTRQHI